MPTNGAKRGPFVLGIDMGTTTVKVCLLDTESKKVVESLSREAKSSISSDLGALGNEQDVHKICTALQFCVSRLAKENLQKVVKIGISGQMHGVVLWKKGEGWKQNAFGRYETENVSVLYTWQDSRCSQEFLDKLPAPDTHLRVSKGYGCTTLFWLQANKPDYLNKYDSAGTVQDFVVAMLCGLDKPMMSVQNAASWGYYNTINRCWNIDRLQAADFPIHLLPDVTQSGKAAGRLETGWYGIPAGTPVGAALGDMQCSVVSTAENDTDAVLNVSTSAQLSFLMPEGFKPPILDPEFSIEFFPYFKDRYLAVAASLNGGNTLAAFVRMLQQWTHALGLGVTEDKIWEKILALAMEEKSDSDLKIMPLLFGERRRPGQRASVSNIDSLNISLGKVSRSLCKGIIANVYDMMPRERLIEAGVTRIVGSGSALTRNQVLKQEVEALFQLPVCYGGQSDAAIGVALSMLNYLE